MKIENNRQPTYPFFRDISQGEVFMDPVDEAILMKIENVQYDGPIICNAICLETGEWYLYEDTHSVIPINAKVVVS